MNKTTEQLRNIIETELRTRKKDMRTIDTPSTNTDYYLPSSGGIDISKFDSVTAFIYATTNKPDQIYLEASLDEGTTWYKLEGYEIDSANFVLGSWNQIQAPLDLTFVRLKVSTGASAPDKIEMRLVRKT